MKSIKNLLTLSLFAATALGAVACDGDDDAAPVTVTPGADSGTPIKDSGTPDSTGPTPDGGPQFPAPPTLGAQIDRMGRPAVNTALNNTFQANATTADTAKDQYNANAAPGNWVATYRSEVAANLAILDALDSNCGNQIFAKAGAAAADTYSTLAGVLADDRLWLNTASTTCTTYLGVELNATGAIPNMDCGGRKLAYDVIDVTYSALALGTPTGFGDTIPAVAAKVGGTTFPYLAPPQ